MSLGNIISSPGNSGDHNLPRKRLQEMKQLRVFGIADFVHQEDLAWMLNAQDINCMGIMSPQSIDGSLEDTVEKVASMPIDVLVLRSSEFGGSMRSFMIEYSKNRRGVAAVLVTDAAITVDLLQTAMASGINNVVYAENQDREKVCEVIREEAAKIRTRSESAYVLSYDSRVIVIYSSKGGVGKTTVAVNLAAALSQKGKKASVIDLDLASGDVHSFLGVSNTESIAELAGEPEPVTPAAIKSYVHQSQYNIGVICAPSAPQHAGSVKPELISRVITTLRAENDYVIVDCGQQLIEGSIAACNEEAMKAADLILFVVTPEVPAINGAYDMIYKYLNRFQGMTDKIRLVVNKSGSASTITGSEIAGTLGLPVFASIPDDYGTVVQTLNTGIPFMSGASDGRKLFRKPIMKAYDQLTDKVLETS